MSKGKGTVSNIKAETLGDKQVLKDLIYKPQRVSFLLKDNTAVANALRRASLSMVPAITMTCSTTDIQTDDHIIPISLKKRLQQIPIDQKFKPTKKYKFEFVNKTEYCMVITGADFFKQVNEKPFFNPTTQIAELGPGRYLRINEIKFAKGTGDDDKTFDVTAGIDFEPLDQGKESSLTALPHMYAMAVYSNGNIDPAAIVKSACGELIKVLQEILISLNSNNKETELPPKYPRTLLEFEGKLAIYRIENVDDTIGNLLAYHIYEMDKNCPLVTYDVEDMPDLVCKVKINHSNHKKLFEKSIDICIQKFGNIAKSFK